MSRKIRRLRQEIRTIDRRIFQLLARRLNRARRVGQEKRRAGMPLRNFEVEAQVVHLARSRSRKLGIDQSLGDELARLLIRAAIAEQEHRTFRTSRVVRR